jgi:hypothetical protein
MTGRSRGRVVWAMVGLLLGTGLLVGGASAGAVRSSASVGPATISNVTSVGTAGYVVSSSSNSVSYAAGTFTVPKVASSACGNASLANMHTTFWVGIGGFEPAKRQIDTNVSIGTGVTASCRPGILQAWYHLSATVYGGFSLKLRVGDKVTAKVEYDGSTGVAKALLFDDTTGRMASHSAVVRGVSTDSAEWGITEKCVAPCTTSARLLMPFGSVGFLGCDATVGGATHPIRGFSSVYQLQKIHGKVKKWGSTPDALTLPLDASGQSFTIVDKGY